MNYVCFSVLSLDILRVYGRDGRRNVLTGFILRFLYLLFLGHSGVGGRDRRKETGSAVTSAFPTFVSFFADILKSEKEVKEVRLILVFHVVSLAFELQ